MDLFAEFGTVIYLYLLAVMFFAGTVHGAIGLGFPMIATPLIAVVFDVRLAILVTLLPTVLVNIASIWGGTDQQSSLKEYAPLFICVLLGALIGSWMLATMDPSPFRLALALLILLYLWTALFKRSPGNWIRQGSLLTLCAFGLVSGISGGITNVMIAILIIYFLSMDMPRTKMIPIFNSCFLIGKLSQIAVLSLAGMVSISLLSQTVLPGIFALAGLWMGKRLGEFISVDYYRKVLHMLLLALAIILIIQFSLSMV